MRPILTVTLILTAALLQACTLTPPLLVGDPILVPQPDLSSCGATGLDGLVGSSVSLLPEDGAWTTLRVIKPGQMVTMDFNAARLNVNVDDAGKVLSLSCG